MSAKTRRRMLRTLWRLSAFERRWELRLAGSITRPHLVPHGRHKDRRALCGIWVRPNAQRLPTWPNPNNENILGVCKQCQGQAYAELMSQA